MNPGKIMPSGGVLGSQAEASKIYKNKPLASVSLVRASAARERAKRAQRAKRRKDTSSSYGPQETVTSNSMWRHVFASLLIKTRFPFTYQTGLILVT